MESESQGRNQIGVPRYSRVDHQQSPSKCSQTSKESHWLSWSLSAEARLIKSTRRDGVVKSSWREEGWMIYVNNQY